MVKLKTIEEAYKWLDENEPNYGSTYSVKYTDAQIERIEKARDLLEPFSHKEMRYYITDIHFVKGGDIANSNFTCCGDEKCILKVKKEIHKNHPKVKLRYEIYGNDSDHERIEWCWACENPLNQYLTWIKDDFEHHEDNSKTKDDFTNLATAFEICVLLNSWDCNDFNFDSNRIKDDMLCWYINKLIDFKERFMDYVELIIKELENK